MVLQVPTVLVVPRVLGVLMSPGARRYYWYLPKGDDHLEKRRRRCRENGREAAGAVELLGAFMG
ncbi:hypothetical protein MICRO116_140015 [Micrococcus sp. 116]|nr:hypothetical protein MICRO116_140015 [Micrococcus sp. 116]